MSLADKMKAARKADDERGPVNLSEITELARQQLELKGEIDALEQELKTKREALRRIAEGQLPAALTAAQLKDFTLANGMKATLKKDLKVSLGTGPKTKAKLAAISFLRENGKGDLVKEQITIDVAEIGSNGRGALLDMAAELGATPTVSEDVNTAQFKKVLNDRRKEGHADDLGSMGAYAHELVEIK